MIFYEKRIHMKKHYILTYLSWVILILPLATLAQEDQKNLPIHVESNQMKYDTNMDQAFAEGEAWAEQGDKKVFADLLVVQFKKEEAPSSDDSKAALSKNIDQILAYDNVRLVSPSEEITGDFAIYDLKTEILTVKGSDIVLTSPKGKIYAHESLSYDKQLQKAIALGDALVIGQGREINAPKIISYFTKDPSQPDEENALVLKRMEAYGGVVIKTSDYISNSQKAIYTASTGLADLIGDVKISDGENIFEGPCGQYNEKTNVSRLVPCSEIGIKESSSSPRARALLFSKKKPSPLNNAPED